MGRNIVNMLVSSNFNLKSFKSYQKYLSFTDRIYEPINFKDNGKFYQSEWPFY